MASFLTPIDAVKAARAMLEEINEFNRSLARREVVLKVGIHRGASVAVTLNDRLDYVGQMVNVASRVQGLADADQLCLTQEVYGTDGVTEALRDTGVVQESSLIKGVQEAVVVFRVKPKEIAAASSNPRAPRQQPPGYFLGFSSAFFRSASILARQTSAFFFTTSAWSLSPRTMCSRRTADRKLMAALKSSRRRVESSYFSR